MCAETSGGVRLRKEVDSSSARTVRGEIVSEGEMVWFREGWSRRERWVG